MQEQRIDPRIRRFADVLVKFQSSPMTRQLEGRAYPSHSLDVSLHGMRLEVDAPVPVGALLELEVRLSPRSGRYRHVGNVVWSDAIDDDDGDAEMPGSLHDVGIRFHTHSNPQFSSWAQAVSSL
jgi:hypothetical protein